MTDDDPRDERLAALLEVEPLDDVTRRRFVAGAVAGASAGDVGPERTGRPTRRLLAAAAVLVVLVIGGTVLLTTGTDHDTRTAAPAPRTPAAQEKAAAPNTAPTADAQAALPTDFGDLGDLSDQATLERARSTLSAASSPTTGSDGSTGATSGRAAQLLAGIAAAPCNDALPDGTVVGLATGRLHGRDATIVVTATPDGGRSFDALLLSPCAVRPLS